MSWPPAPLISHPEVSAYEDIFIYLLIVFQNPYTSVRPMDIGTVKE
jgi:hypothetical protein